MAKKLVLVGRDDPLSGALLGAFTAHGYACEVLRLEDAGSADSAPLVIERRLTDLSPDVVVICPSWRGRGDFLDSSAEAWQEALYENVEVVTYVMQAAANVFKASQKEGRIIVTSHVGALTPFRGLSLLGTTLAAVKALVKMLALELAPIKTTVNSVALGPFMEGLELPDASTDKLKQDTPLQDDMLTAAAEVCLFLASKAGGHLTGQTLPVEGGFLLTRASGGSPYAD